MIMSEITQLQAENAELKAENAKLQEELAKWERLAAGIDLPEYPVTQFKPKDLERENAKLCEQLDIAEHNQTRNAREYARLCHENDKLRELVDILCFCMQIRKRCDDCKLNGAKGELGLGHDPLLACDGLHEMLKELGIEVDDG